MSSRKLIKQGCHVTFFLEQSSQERQMDAAFISDSLKQSEARAFSAASLRTFWQQYNLMPENNVS